MNPTHPNKEYEPIWDELDPHVKAFIVRQYYTDFNLKFERSHGGGGGEGEDSDAKNQ